MPFWAELQRRQNSMGILRRTTWRIHCRVHRIARSMKDLVASFYEEVATAPKKTLVDVVTGLPLGLLVIPKVRDWVFAQPYAWTVYSFLILSRVLYGAWRRGALGRLSGEATGKALQRILPVIECTRIHVEARAQGEHLPPAQLQRNIESVLSAISELTIQALQIPATVKVSSNLMLPMPVQLQGEEGLTSGCGIVAYNSMPAAPSWTRLALGEFGAGRVFTTGKVQAVEDTTDPVWCGLFKENRSRCFASFPVRAGGAEVIAVVNVDASRPRVLTRRVADALFADVLSAGLKLLGDLLIACSTDTTERPNDAR